VKTRLFGAHGLLCVLFFAGAGASVAASIAASVAPSVAAPVATAGKAVNAQASSPVNPLLPLQFNCEQRSLSVSEKDKLNFSRAALASGIKGKATQADLLAAFGEYDVMLTSMYKMRKPLMLMPEGSARDAMMRTAWLILRAHPIAAQMSYGSMMLEAGVPQDAARLTQEIVETLIAPYGEDDELSELLARTQKADLMMETMTPGAKRYGRWVVRARIYNDQIGLDTALAGYCTMAPTPQDNKILQMAGR
jgi:hypothetical protein